MDNQTSLTSLQQITPDALTNIAALGRAAENAAGGLDHLQIFLDTKRPETKRRYQSNLRDFQAFLKMAAASVGLSFETDLYQNLDAWAGMTPELLLAYQQHLVRQGYKISTVNLMTYTVRAFCTVARDAGVLDTHTHALIQGVKGYTPHEAENIEASRRKGGLPVGLPGGMYRTSRKKTEWTLLTADQIKQLLRYCSEQAQQGTTRLKRRHGLRDMLLILLCFRLGLRVGEIVGLTLSSLAIKSEGLAILTVDRPKVYLTGELAQRLEVKEEVLTGYLQWLTLRRSETSNTHAPLFQAERRGDEIPMREGTISQRLATLAKHILGIEHLSTHDGRHYWIDDAIEAGTDIKTFTSAGGWKRPEMPLRHYARKKDIANAGIKGTSLALE